MKRVILAVFLVIGLGLIGVHGSRADQTEINGYCFAGPAESIVSCTTPTATGTPPALAEPDKELAVSGATPGPAGTSSYDVQLTSKFLCFSLDEPIHVYALGSDGAAVLDETYPTPGLSSGRAAVVYPQLTPDIPGSGTAHLSLEVNNRAVANEGLKVKAVWPDENVERIEDVIGTATPTATATPYPGQPTNTPAPPPTNTPTATPTPSVSPTATVTPTATPLPALFTRTCIVPPILSGPTKNADGSLTGGEDATIYGLTVPGATCTAQVLYLDDTTEPTFDGSVQTADTGGLVSFLLQEQTTSGGGVVRLQCGLAGQTQAACTGFLVLQSSDNGLTDQEQQDLLGQIRSLVDTPAKCNAVFGV